MDAPLLNFDESRLFESINLNGGIHPDGYIPESTILSNRPLPQIHRSVPGSVSNTSDEEDEDLDPMEFLSTEHQIAANLLPNIPIKNSTPDTNSGTGSTPSGLASTEVMFEGGRILDVPNVSVHNLFLNPSVMSSSNGVHRSFSTSPIDSQRKVNMIESEILGTSLLGLVVRHSFANIGSNIKHGNSQESPIEMVLNRGKFLDKELLNNTHIQRQMLESGDQRLGKVRNMIAQMFEQVADNHKMLHELYWNDLRNVSTLFENFKEWDIKRERVLKKIVSIKSSKHKYGSKLMELAGEAHKVDEEIDTLEQRIKTLKEKRSLLNAEIENTSSVLESRTSAYVQTFKNLEKEGNEAIQTILDLSGVSRSEQSNIIKKVPVDVTFSHQFHKSLPNKDFEKLSSIGSTLPTSQNKQNHPTVAHGDKLSSQNPYERGFSMGTELSHNAKIRLTTFVNSVLKPAFISSLVQYSKSVLDDNNNTIREKLELEPILQLLNHKMQALKGLIDHHTNLEKSYRQYNLIWRDVIDILNQMENSLFSHISTSVLSGPDSTALTIIESNLNKIVERFKLQAQSSKIENTNDAPIFEVLLNEIRAVTKATSIVRGDDNKSTLISDLRKLAGLANANKKNNNSSTRGNAPIPTGFMSSGIDARQNAMREVENKEQAAPFDENQIFSTSKKDKHL